MADERLYAKVVEELKQSGPIPGLWAKAFAECNGNEVEAKAMYLRLRVAQLAIEEVKSKSEGCNPSSTDRETTLSLWYQSVAPILLVIVAVACLIAIVLIFIE